MGEVYRARDPRLGREVCAICADGQTVLYSARWEGGPGELFINRSESPESRPYGLTGADILAISRTRRGEVPAKVYLFDIVTGRKELWRERMPADASGVVDVPSVCPTPDGKSYVYSYARILSSPFLVEGVK
jgi:hypothetical protein